MSEEEKQLELKIDRVCELLRIVDKAEYVDVIKHHLAFRTVKETCRIIMEEMGLPSDIIEWRVGLL